ncbi:MULTISPECIES: gamma carbonic anhydrase family protein [Calditerrivibrio]|jgi:carbonic anhydrase/acetyltransferase-like protein (isoleucine patch superfamily)|uniref:gamma carbonic anhydrase family protein n=1 Tax=Calditerrivibrio TaxID=545865 RepID=UPI003C790AC9
MNNVRKRISKTPEIGERVFIASNAIVFGDITLCNDVSIWYNVVIRADVERVEIGECSNVQDGTVIHVTKDKHPTIIGKNVTIGHNATLHGCKIKDNVLVGIGAIVLDNTVISENTIIAAGTLVPPNKTFPPNSLIMGSPGKVVKTLTDEEIKSITDYADRYVKYKDIYIELNNNGHKL